LKIVNNIAIIYSERGDYDSVIDSERDLAGSKAFFGENHISIKITLNRLACTYP